jgi:hypothetical protein
MSATGIENFDLAVERIPGIEPLAVLISPSLDAVDGTEWFEAIKK